MAVWSGEEEEAAAAVAWVSKRRERSFPVWRQRRRQSRQRATRSRQIMISERRRERERKGKKTRRDRERRAKTKAAVTAPSASVQRLLRSFLHASMLRYLQRFHQLVRYVLLCLFANSCEGLLGQWVVGSRG